jgi:hypothetical protein
MKQTKKQKLGPREAEFDPSAPPVGETLDTTFDLANSAAVAQLALEKIAISCREKLEEIAAIRRRIDEDRVRALAWQRVLNKETEITESRRKNASEDTRSKSLRKR